MSLDYMLENNSDHYLESEVEKVRFFTEDRGIAPEVFIGSDGKLFPLLASCPISILDRTRPAQSLVRFAFIDEELATTAKFLRFLSLNEALLRSVGNFELAYVSASAVNFSVAKDAFRGCFSIPAPRSHLYLPKLETIAGTLPPYPDPLLREELFVIAGELHRQLKPTPSPAPRWQKSSTP